MNNTSKPELKIGIILQSPDYGGAEEYMLMLIECFLQDGNQIILATNKGKLYDKARKHKIIIIKIPVILDVIGNIKGLIKSIYRLPFVFYFYIKLLYFFKKQKVNIILMSGFSEKLLVTFLSQFFNLPVIWIEYGSLKSIFKRNIKIPELLYKYLKNIPGLVIVPSRHTLNSLISDAGMTAQKLKLIPCGVYTPPANKKRKSIILPEWKNKLIVGNISRLTTEKGQHILIQAMPEVLKVIPDARLFLAGEGPDRKLYQSIIDRLSLNDTVILKGFVENTDIYYDFFDIFVFPTVWELEGFGLVLAEAMAHHLPVIASDMGPVKEIIKQDINGLLIKPVNPRNIAAAIIKLGRDKHMRIAMGENNYLKTINEYNIRKSSMQILEACRSSATIYR